MTETVEPGTGDRKTTRGIPLDLAAVLGPYARRRMMLIRVEYLPLNSYLSHGTYAGPRAWSLKADELDNLVYTPPEAYDRPHTLKIRILSLDNNTARTLSVVEIPVDPSVDYEDIAEDGADGAAKNGTSSNGSELAAAKEAWEAVTELRIQEALYVAERESAGEEMRRLTDELASAKRTLSEGQAAIGEARAEFDRKLKEQATAAKRDAESRLKQAEETWRAETERAVAAATEAALAELQAKAGQEAGEEIGRMRADLTEATQSLADARAEFERRADEIRAEADKAADARVKAAEDALRKDAARAVANATARAERAEAAVADLHARADEETDDALLRLGDELAAVRQTLGETTERAENAEKALDAAGTTADGEIAALRQRLADAEAAQADTLDELRRMRADAEATLATRVAEAVREAEQTAESRLTAARETLTAEAEKALGEAMARAEAAETALSELRDAASANDETAARLNEELDAAKQVATEAMARAETAESAVAQARDAARAEAEAALSEKIAEAVHKAEAEAECRLTAAEESWREVAARDLADVKARADQAESELVALRETAGEQTDAELIHLREELAMAKQALAESREAQERQAAKDAEAAQRHVEEQLKVAEETWRVESAQEIEELTARAEKAEAALAQSHAAPGAASAAAGREAGAASQAHLLKAQDEMLANAERRVAVATARAERAESELVKARMQVDRRSDDVIHDLENDIKNLKLALAAAESTLDDAQAEFDRKLDEQRALYHQTAQQRAEAMVRMARKEWESQAGAGGGDTPAARERTGGAEEERRGWLRSKGGLGLFGLGGAKGT